MTDPREELKRGDRCLERGAVWEALDAYANVARFYDAQGFALKSVALWKQIRGIIASSPGDHADFATEARGALITLYRKLGLEADAKAIEAEPSSVQ